MKKLFLILMGGTVAALVTGAVMIWYATADAAMTVIMANTRYIKRQIPFDYDKLIVGSDWLRPTITMTNPSIRFDASDEKYTLKAEQVLFIGSLASLGEYTIHLPQEIALEKTFPAQEKTVMQVVKYPEVEVRSALPVEGKPAEGVYLDQFRIERFKPLQLKLENQAELNYTPSDLVTLKWGTVSYEVSPYLRRFSGDVNRVKNATAISR